MTDKMWMNYALAEALDDTPPKDVPELIALIKKHTDYDMLVDNAEFFGNIEDPADRNQARANAALCLAIDAINGVLNTPATIAKRIYPLVKMVFGSIKNSERGWHTDFSGAYSEFGSPWDYLVYSPEEFTISHAIFALEDDEATITPEGFESAVREVIELSKVGIRTYDLEEIADLVDSIYFQNDAPFRIWSWEVDDEFDELGE